MEPWADKFLKALEASPNVSKACKVAGISRVTAYKYRHDDKDFACLWDEALDVSLDDLEESMFGRAKDTSDTLAIFLMKSHRPERYGEKLKIDFSGRIELDWGDSQADQNAPPSSGAEDG